MVNEEEVPGMPMAQDEFQTNEEQTELSVGGRKSRKSRKSHKSRKSRKSRK